MVIKMSSLYKVLFVDDEGLTREEVSKNVPWKSLGYELIGSCQNGKEALEVIGSHPIDLVLTDICMPYMDGMDLSKALHEKYPKTKIIILSGYDEFEYAKRALKYNVEEYILKPVTALELGETLRKLKGTLDKEREADRVFGKMNTAYRKSKMLLYSNAMQNCIVGNKTEEESRKELKELGIELMSTYYRVAVLQLDLYAKDKVLEEKEKRESALMAFVAYNISQEVVKAYEAGYVCQGKDLRTLLLLCTNRKKEFDKRVLDICSKIVNELKETMNLDATIGLGSYVQEVKDIYHSYEEAEHATEFRYISGSRQVIEIGMEKTGSGENKALEQCIESYILHMKAGEFEKTAKDIDKMKEEIWKTPIEKDRIFLYFRQMMDKIGELLKGADLKDASIYQKQYEVLKNMMKDTTLEESLERLKGYGKEVEESLEGQKNTRGKRYAVLALNFIEKNYGDSSLNLATVCSYLNISTSRFSSIFKNTTGKTFMEVLIQTRMEKAKELLSNTDMKNYEIAEKVGFSDPHYFSISFKKIIGKTPTEFAKEMRF